MSFGATVREESSKRFLGNDPFQAVISNLLPQFDRTVSSYFIFNVLFLSVGFLEFILLILFFTFLIQSALLALSLAVVFLTFSSYFIVRLYLQTKKNIQMEELRELYMRHCKELIEYSEGTASHHLALATACKKLSDQLSGSHYRTYKFHENLVFLEPYFKRFNQWYYWSDVYSMQELLLQYAVQENIKLVKCQPTSLEAHSSLANAYVVLSMFYNDSRKNAVYSWIMKQENLNAMQQKFQKAAERAIEELKIINNFSPNNAWTHLQLAYSYRDLKMPLEEIKEYEVVLMLDPDDTNTLFNLGVLYFQQGMNAKGLNVYNQLRQSEPKKANDLIAFYGAYSA